MNFSKLNFLTELGSISFGLNHFRIFVSSFPIQIQASYSVFLSFHDFNMLSLVIYFLPGIDGRSRTDVDKGEHLPVFEHTDEFFIAR